MYRCDNCGSRFSEPDTVLLSHGLDAPPFERFGICPYCRSSGFEELLEDRMKRTEVLRYLIEAAMHFNTFIKRVEDVLSDEALSEFDAGYSRLYELIDLAAVGRLDKRLPANFGDILSEVETDGGAEAVYRFLCENIAEE